MEPPTRYSRARRSLCLRSPRRPVSFANIPARSLFSAPQRVPQIGEGQTREGDLGPGHLEISTHQIKGIGSTVSYASGHVHDL